jgi:hypothetical protein
MWPRKLGRILVLPVVEEQDAQADAHEPLLLLALNSTDSVDWEDMQAKVS